MYILGPPVIILKVADLETSSTSSCKPPNAVCLYPFLDQSCIGCSSSTVYDVVSFVSIAPDAPNKLLLVTKIKQRWRISSMNRLIGNGDKLAKLFAKSRIVMLERVRNSNTNLVFAIATSRTSIVFLKQVCRTLYRNNYII